MENKDIYEHLSQVYLDTPSKRIHKTKEYSKIFKNPIFLSITAIFVLTIFLFASLKEKGKSLNSETALVLCPDIVKINFHFDPAKKEVYSIDLNRLDLNRFNALGFSVRKGNYKDNISLRVEFTNTFREKSELYFKDISHKWQDYRVALLEFRNISNWSKMTSLSFIMEEWNVKEKRGVVYIDNIRFLRL